MLEKKIGPENENDFFNVSQFICQNVQKNSALKEKY
jgi:hypothetical protein